MVIKEIDSREDRIIDVAKKMMTAARTAPKAKGVDCLEIGVATGETITLLSETMKELAEKLGMMFFIRDAENILHADAILLIGTHINTFGLNCGYCGFPTCAAKQQHENIPCAFNMNDLGIATGSAVSMAADLRVDTRVMFSVGVAAKELNLLEPCHAIMAIPISCSGKNPFFDRQSTR